MIVVFDLDGTLVDASALHARILSRLLGKDVNPEIIYDSGSLQFFVMENIEAKNWSSIKDITRVHEAEMLKNVELVKPMPGVYEVLTAIKAKKALFTSASRKLTLAILKELNINGYFDVIITSSDVGKTKPDSEGLYMISNELNDNHLVVIGNGERDVLAAKKVGAISVLFSPKKAPKNVADFTVKSLAEVLNLVESLEK